MQDRVKIFIKSCKNVLTGENADVILTYENVSFPKTEKQNKGGAKSV